MNREKQIEEMARLLWHMPKAFYLNCYNDCCEVAKILYEECYRKQSEGKWIEKKRFYASGKTLVHYQCSLCGVYLATKANFCPNCGAKMKGGVQE